MPNKFIPVLIILIFANPQGYSQNIAMPEGYASIAICDINGDENQDILFSGNSNTGNSGIALNSGSSTFTLTACPLNRNSTSAGWADLNNDGTTDYFMFGSGEGANILYLNNGAGSFTRSEQFGDLHFLDPDVTVIDVENDGDADLFITAWDVKESRRYSDLLLNNGHGIFTPAHLNIIQKGFGSSAWADVNADGFADLLMNGDGDSYGDGGSFDIYRLYLNNGDGSFSEKQTFKNYRQISVGDGSRFADWNNDGFSDIILTGWSSTENRQATCIFLNDGSGNFSRSNESDIIPGVSESSIETADMDNDGRIDLLLTGYSGNYGRRVALIYYNQTASVNTSPGPPSNTSFTINSENIEFSWESGTDPETPIKSLSYNIGLRNISENSWIISPNSVVGGQKDGFRKISGMGNAFLNHSWKISGLPEGKYGCIVQTIDASYTGSAFTPEVIFCIKDTSRLQLLLNSAKNHIQQASPGSGIGQYPALAINSLQDSIDKLEPWITDIGKEAFEIEIPLSLAVQNFNSSRIGVDVSTLSGLIETANNLKLNAIPGDRKGNFPPAAINALNEVITHAELEKVQAEIITDVNDIPALSDTINATVVGLQNAMDLFSSQSIKINADAFSRETDSASKIHDTAIPGSCQGNYLPETRRQLALAIDSAWQVKESPAPSQSEIDQAVINLRNAVTRFFNHVIILDHEKLKILIDSATAIYDNTISTDYKAGARFALARAIYTAGVVDKNNSVCNDLLDGAVDLLKNSITDFNKAKLTGISVETTKVSIYPNPAFEKIFVKGIPQGSAIKLVNSLGLVLYAEKSMTNVTSINTSKYSEGLYLIFIEQPDGEIFVRKFILKKL